MLTVSPYVQHRSQEAGVEAVHSGPPDSVGLRAEKPVRQTSPGAAEANIPRRVPRGHGGKSPRLLGRRRTPGVRNRRGANGPGGRALGAGAHATAAGVFVSSLKRSAYPDVT